MDKKIKNINELASLVLAWRGNERGLNAKLVKMVNDGNLPLVFFLEYLAITQGDVKECMEEQFKD